YVPDPIPAAAGAPALPAPAAPGAPAARAAGPAPAARVPRAAPVVPPSIAEDAPALPPAPAVTAAAPPAAPAGPPPRPGAVVDARGRAAGLPERRLRAGDRTPTAPPPARPTEFKGPDGELLRLQDEVLALALEALRRPSP